VNKFCNCAGDEAENDPGYNSHSIIVDWLHQFKQQPVPACSLRPPIG